MRQITYKGRTQSINKWAAELGIKVSTLRGRLNSNKWSVERALTIQTRNKVLMQYKGQKKTMSQWCRELDLCLGTSTSRLLRGWAIEKILETPIRKNLTVTVKGITRTVKQWCAETGLSDQTIRKYAKLDPDKILEPKPQDCVFTERKLKYQGKTKTIAQWSKLTGLTILQLRYRYDRGYTPEEILMDRSMFTQLVQLTAEEWQELLQLHSTGTPVTVLARRFRCSRTAIYNKINGFKMGSPKNNGRKRLAKPPEYVWENSDRLWAIRRKRAPKMYWCSACGCETEGQHGHYSDCTRKNT